MTRRAQRGFVRTELIVAALLITLIVAVATAGWEERGARLRLRAATIQVAWDLARARQAARESRSPLVATFAASNSAYMVARAEEPFERVELPEGVVPETNVIVTFPPGAASPADQTVILKTASGRRSAVHVRASGSISYALP